MAGNAKKRWLWLAAFALILAAAYSSLGILQAMSLYQGERLLSNVRIWGTATVVGLIGASVCIFFAVRRGRPSPPAAQDF